MRHLHPHTPDAQVHGISEAWITSGTPLPPTDLMARSTSFKGKRCVVIFSSGKRFEAIWCNASSHAFQLWPRALFKVIALVVIFPIGKLGNSANSPCTTMRPALRF